MSVQIVQNAETVRGTKFGKYRLLSRIAVGGMAEIFLARLSGTAGFEKLVVIKRILPHLAEEQRFVEMFLDEARIVSRMSHPNICPVYELGEVDGQYFIAMEYMRGAPMSKYMKRLKRDRGTWDIRMTCALIVQACEGLHYAHELKDYSGEKLNIIHRDVSPQNLFITTDGVLKALDFGVAKAANASTKTRTGAVKGKYAYMSPEQIEAKTVDRRTDVFALGVILFESITGRRLFYRETDFQIYKAITQEDIPSVRRFRPNVPTELADVIDKALARNPEDRFSTARLLGAALEKAASSMSGIVGQSAIATEIDKLFAEELQAQDDLISQVATGPGELVEDIVEAPHKPANPNVFASDGQADPAASTKAIAPGARFIPEGQSEQTQDSVGEHALPLAAPPEPSAAHDGVLPANQPYTAPSQVALGAQAYTAHPSSASYSAGGQPQKRPRWMSPVVVAIAGLLLGIATTYLLFMRGDNPAGVRASNASDLQTDAAAQVGDASPSTHDPAVLPPTVAKDAAPVVPDSAKIEARPPKKSKRVVKKSRKPVVRKPKGPGYFTLIPSAGHAEIFVDGKRLSWTPLYRAQLPAGKHKITAKTKDGRRKSFTVKIRPGKETRKTLRLE